MDAPQSNVQHNNPPPIAAAASRDPSQMTSELITTSITSLRDLMESQFRTLEKALDSFALNHEEKHRTTVDAAIAHRKELTDSQFNSVTLRFKAMGKEMDERFSSSETRYQERFTSQNKALDAAFMAQQDAVKSALEATREAIGAALVASERALEKVESANNDRFQTLGQAIAAHSVITDRVEKLYERVEGLNTITEAKFVTFRALVDAESDKVSLALSASDKAVMKAETFNEKRFDLITKAIDELKESSTTAAGRGAGMASGWGYLVAAITVVVIVVNVFISMAGK